ncbi:unnamed protein product [Adineta steineri]|uniref:NHL repeat containing protein n=1 Tax=Adineta steineri TaxID=433720 RepID=A0A813QHK2_9BILA|nr:unnamed protein product [Adineta steineri]CAF0924277.1 unnamed protein product [Adineta steineri]
MNLTEHHQRLNKELHDIINDYDQFKQRINERKQNPYNHVLIKEIDQWERTSIEKIQQKAKDSREIVTKSSQTCINDNEKKYNDLTEQIQQLDKENDFNESNFNYLTNQLTKITEKLNNPSTISIEQDSQAFINDVSIILSKKPKFNKYKQNAITVAGGNKQGHELNQLIGPMGIFIDEKKNIFIADTHNHRIIEWKCDAKEGHITAGGNGRGDRMNQLNQPQDVIVDPKNHSIIIADYSNRRVIQWLNQNQQILIDNIDCYSLAVDQHGFLYVSDCEKNEVRRWKIGESNNEGMIVAGGNGKGDQLNQLNFPTFIFVDENQSVYVSDMSNHRVMKWRKDAREGRIVAVGNGKGANLNQLSEPQGVIVDHFGQIYVADYGNARIMRWYEEKEEGEIIVGRNAEGNQLNDPCGLSFDDEENLYVVDSHNHRIQKFEIIV